MYGELLWKIRKTLYVRYECADLFCVLSVRKFEQHALVEAHDSCEGFAFRVDGRVTELESDNSGKTMGSQNVTKNKRLTADNPCCYIPYTPFESLRVLYRVQ